MFVFVALLLSCLKCSGREIIEDYYNMDLLGSIRIEVYSIDEMTFNDISKNKIDINKIDINNLNKCLSNSDYKKIFLSLKKYQISKNENNIYSFSAILNKRDKLFNMTSENPFLLMVVNDKYKRIVRYAIPDSSKSIIAGFFTIAEVKEITGESLFHQIVKSEINYNKQNN